MSQRRMRRVADVRIGIIGFGKIARDQHVPAIAATPGLVLAAVVAPDGAPDAGVPIFAGHEAMIAAVPLDAVAVSTPAGPRYRIARDCLDAGLDVLLEKPPTTTLGEIEALAALAQAKARVLFTAWHAQHNAAVDQLRDLLAREGLASLDIQWREDVNKWHPGQSWVWQPSGFGVFDAGINALSIATRISPAPLIVREARFVPHGPAVQPIAASLVFTAEGSAGPLTATLDWRHQGEEQWTIEGRTASGTGFLLSGGGHTLRIGDAAPMSGDVPEYHDVYRTFADLIRRREPLVEREPLRLLADTFLLADRSG